MWAPKRYNETEAVLEDRVIRSDGPEGSGVCIGEVLCDTSAEKTQAANYQTVQDLKCQFKCSSSQARLKCIFR